MEFRHSQLSNNGLNKAIVTLVVLFMVNLSYAQSIDVIRYTILKGDTLWDIASRHLEKPWLWQQLWQQNLEITNPDLIFPGDVLLISPEKIRLIRSTRLHREKLHPKIHETPIHEAITTIEPDAIMPFLNQSILVEDEKLVVAARVLQGINNETLLSKESTFYATELANVTHSQYQIFRIGRPIFDQTSQTTYGIEGVHLGTASLLANNGEVATMQVDKANQEIRPGDRLLPMPQPTVMPRYFPHKPDVTVDASVVMIPKGVNEAGRRDIVIVSAGANDQLEIGHVLNVFSYKGEVKDPFSNEILLLPDINIATALVFKTYAKLSYAILMRTTMPVKAGDRVSSP